MSVSKLINKFETMFPNWVVKSYMVGIGDSDDALLVKLENGDLYKFMVSEDSMSLRRYENGKLM